MSIYATGWNIQVAMEPRGKSIRVGPGQRYNPLWIEVYCQFVPGHIGHISHYPHGDPYADFLPPALVCSEEECYGRIRAAVIVQEGRDEKDVQRYTDPLLVLSMEEYNGLNTDELLDRIRRVLREKNQELLENHPWVVED